MDKVFYREYLSVSRNNVFSFFEVEELLPEAVPNGGQFIFVGVYPNKTVPATVFADNAFNLSNWEAHGFCVRTIMTHEILHEEPKIVDLEFVDSF